MPTAVPAAAPAAAPAAPQPRRRRRRWVIDADMGADDGAALLVALHAEGVEVAAITCVWGNIGVDQAVRNALTLLEFVGQDDVPVYRGADAPLLGRIETKGWEGHGKDGFGDAGFAAPRRAAAKGHAAEALARLLGALPPRAAAADDDGDEEREVWQLVALGPLTNVALALRIHPGLFAGLGGGGVPGVVVMGAAQEAKGNSGLAAEFNWHSDPEAAYVVAHAAGRGPCPERMLVVSWEATLACPLTWREYDAVLGRGADADAADADAEGAAMRRRARDFLSRLLARLESFTRPQADGSAADTGDDESTQGATCVLPDAVAVVAALDPEGLAEEGGYLDTYVAVDRDGRSSRGATVIDWYGTDASIQRLGRWRNARILTKVRPACLVRHMRAIVERHAEVMAAARGRAPPP